MLDSGSDLILGLSTKLRELIPAESSVVVFDYAVFRNVGDLLISESVEHFLASNHNKVLDRFSMQNQNAALEKKFPKDAIFVFQGGGNFGDLFRGHQEKRLEILERFPDQRAVILPQTMFYQDKNVLRDDARKLSRNRNLSICLRDAVSFDVAREYFENSLFLLPDTAHLLQDDFGIRNASHKELNFLRLDQGAYSVTGLDVLPGDRAGFIDWPSFLTQQEVKTIHRFQKLHSWDGDYHHTRLTYFFWSRFRRKLLNRAAELFLESGSVTTNRLHGLIFSIITRRPVKIVESGYGKVSAYYETFLKDFQSVSINDAKVHRVGGLADMRP